MMKRLEYLQEIEFRVTIPVSEMRHIYLLLYKYELETEEVWGLSKRTNGRLIHQMKEFFEVMPTKLNDEIIDEIACIKESEEELREGDDQ